MGDSSYLHIWLMPTDYTTFPLNCLLKQGKQELAKNTMINPHPSFTLHVGYSSKLKKYYSNLQLARVKTLACPIHWCLWLTPKAEDDSFHELHRESSKRRQDQSCIVVPGTLRPSNLVSNRHQRKVRPGASPLRHHINP